LLKKLKIFWRNNKTLKHENIKTIIKWEILNYIEGYARKKSLVQLNFFEISYGSFKESKYLLFFSQKRKFITQDEYNEGLMLAEEIGKMLWTEMNSLEKSIKSQKQ